MNPPPASLPFREMRRRDQHAAFRELTRTPGPVRKLNFRIHAVKFVIFFLLLYFVVSPLIDREGGGMFLPLLVFIVIAVAIDEVIWRFLQVPAAEKELKGRPAAEVLAEGAARSAAEHQPEKW